MINNDSNTLNAILQSIAEGLVVIDMDGKIAEVNKKFEEMLGWSEQEVVGQIFTDIVKKVDSSGIEVPIEARTKDIESDSIEAILDDSQEHYYVRKDGSKFPVSITSAPVMNGGIQIGVVQTFRDISEHMEVDKAKSDFVSLASHQMRTPLTVIKWYSEMLLDEDRGNLTIPQRSYLSKIFDALDRINGLINTFLNITKLQMNKYVIENKLIDVNGIIDDVRKSLRDDIKTQNILIDITIPPSLEKINLDPKVLETVLFNLLSNAVKYSPKDSQIKLKFFQILGENNTQKLAIEVEDKGVGIPKEQQHKLFDKLFRGDNVKKIDTEGTGLSLYILKLILGKIDGEINFESVESKGSIFRVFIPLSVEK